MLDIEQIVFELRLGFFDARAVSIFDLRPASNAWPHRVAQTKQRDVLLEDSAKVRLFRARPNQAHFTAQNIEKLRKLVEPELSKYSANSSDARILILSPTWALVLGILIHRAKFQDLEQMAAKTGTLLAKQNGAAGFEQDSDGAQSHNGEGQNQCDQGDAHIDCPLSGYRGGGF